jgi:hypothetical protein
MIILSYYDNAKNILKIVLPIIYELLIEEIYDCKFNIGFYFGNFILFISVRRLNLILMWSLWNFQNQ